MYVHMHTYTYVWSPRENTSGARKARSPLRLPSATNMYRSSSEMAHLIIPHVDPKQLGCCSQTETHNLYNYKYYY